MCKFSLLLILAATGAGEAQTKSPRKLIPSLDGKDLYVSYCASCHGIDAKGRGPVAPALKAPVPDLTLIQKRHRGKFPVEALEKLIIGDSANPSAHGSREMPVWGPYFLRVENDRDLGLVRVRRLVEYIGALQAK